MAIMQAQENLMKGNLMSGRGILPQNIAEGTAKASSSGCAVFYPEMEQELLDVIKEWRTCGWAVSTSKM